MYVDGHKAASDVRDEFVSVTEKLMDELAQCYNVLLFFFNDTATTEIYALSLHDALPISSREGKVLILKMAQAGEALGLSAVISGTRSEEHTSELQSQSNLVCRLLLEKKKNSSIIVICMLTAIRLLLTFVMSLYLLLRS